MTHPQETGLRSQIVTSKTLRRSVVYTWLHLWGHRLWSQTAPAGQSL